MKVKKIHLAICFGAVLLALGLSFVHLWAQGEPNNRAIAFVTIGIDQTALPDEVSSYELQRAAEHFSYIMIGWTMEPGFENEVISNLGEGYSYSATKQEKQSVIFSVYGPDGLVNNEEIAKTFLSLIEGRIAEYNEATNAGYVLAVKRFSYIDGERSELRVVLGAVLFSLIFSILFLMYLGYGNAPRH